MKTDRPGDKHTEELKLFTPFEQSPEQLETEELFLNYLDEEALSVLSPEQSSILPKGDFKKRLMTSASTEDHEAAYNEWMDSKKVNISHDFTDFLEKEFSKIGTTYRNHNEMGSAVADFSSNILIVTPDDTEMVLYFKKDSDGSIDNLVLVKNRE